jgi:hypothetical protein
MFGMSLNVGRPRETSKSVPNNGCFRTRARAAAISFCSSAEGEHTLSMITFTGRCCDAAVETAHAITPADNITLMIFCTPEF